MNDYNDSLRKIEQEEKDAAEKWKNEIREMSMEEKINQIIFLLEDIRCAVLDRD